MGTAVADRHRQSATAAFGFGYAGHALGLAAARGYPQRSYGDGERSADRLHPRRSRRRPDRICDRGEPLLRRGRKTAVVFRLQHSEIDLPADVHPGVRRRLLAKGRFRVLLNDLQSHRRHSCRNVRLARWYRPSDRDLGRELPDEAVARRRDHDRRDRHDIQRTGQIGRNTMQPLANVTPLKPAARAGSIAVRNVGQIFRTSTQDVEALSDLSLEVKPGRFVVLVGPSGCGKSTLLMMMAGLRQQTSGTILINDAPIPQPDPDRVGVVFQEPSLFPWLTAEENVEIG